MRVPFPDKCFNEDTMASPYSFILKPRKGPQSNEPFIYKTCEVFYFFFFMSLSGESSLIYSRCSLKRVEKGEMMGKKKKTVKVRLIFFLNGCRACGSSKGFLLSHFNPSPLKEQPSQLDGELKAGPDDPHDT